MNKKLIIMLSTAVIAAMVLTAFPLHIEPSHNSDWPFVITIGSPVSAQEADYTCDGADDNVQFQAALDALPGAGGQLFVLAGNYTFADSTTVTRAIDHVSIIGVSAAVSFTGDGSTAIFTAGGNGWLFSNLEVDAGGLNMSATTDYMWLHVIVDSAYYPLKTDAINIEDHSALHGVGGADTIFPADPGADKYLMWDDDPGQLSWEDGGGIGDMAKATYDIDEDGDIDTAAGGTEWDSSAATGVAYITAGAWGTRSTGISNTYIIIVDDADAANGDIPYFTTSGLAGYNEAEFKSAYNMEAGTDYQAYDAELAAIAGLTSAANKMIYFTGSGTADVSDLTAFARSILDDTDEATFKATVNLEIGTDVQAYDSELAALAGVTSAADKVPYFTGSGAADVTGLSAFTRGFLDDADEATFKATVNLEIGTDVQAYDSELAALAGVTSAADKVPYFTGSGAADVTGLSAFTRGFLDDADEATFKATVNLEIGTDVLAQQTIGIANDNLLEVDDDDVTDNDYAKFTANGLEGREYPEVVTDILPSFADQITGTHLSEDFGASSLPLMVWDFTPTSGAAFNVGDGADSPFSGDIDDNAGAHGGQGLDATHVPFDNESNLNCLKGIQVSNGSYRWGRFILYNSDDSNSYRLVVDFDESDKVITTESSVDDWTDGDAITLQSVTCTQSGYMDIDLSDEIDATNVMAYLHIDILDKSAGAQSGRRLILHPYSAYDAGKRVMVGCALASEFSTTTAFLPIVSQKMCVYFDDWTDGAFQVAVLGVGEYADT